MDKSSITKCLHLWQFCKNGSKKAKKRGEEVLTPSPRMGCSMMLYEEQYCLFNSQFSGRGLLLFGERERQDAIFKGDLDFLGINVVC